MTLALQNKQLLALIVVALLTVLAIVAFVVMGLAHVNLFEALHIAPNILAPWY
jgi:hypothetical protein